MTAFMRCPLVPILAFFIVSSAGGRAAEEFVPSKAHWTITDSALRETSGLAASPGDERFLWAINDSGNTPDLFLLDGFGGAHGRVRISAQQNSDWEDLASFTLDGRPYLLIADTGDNLAGRKLCALIVVPEPDVRNGQVDGDVEPAWVIRFVYEDGPRDCEAVAVDARERKVFLISKRTWPPMLYEIPLRPPSSKESVVARRIGSVNLPKADAWEGPYAAQPTGLSFSPDGLVAAVLTYARVFLFPRRPGEDWGSAFAREPVKLSRHGLEQAEGIGFSRNGRNIHVVSEGLHGSMVTYEASAK